MVVRLGSSSVSQDSIIIDREPIGGFIDRADPSEVWFRLVQGRSPSAEESAVFRAILCAMGDHGDTPPSTQSARLVASSGSGIHCALASALLSFGDHHAGAIERAMELFGASVRDMVNPWELVSSFLSRGERIPGFGHRVHRQDPRVAPLVRKGLSLRDTRHLRFFLAVQEELTRLKGIRGNIDGVAGALLLDMGFPPEVGRGVFFCGRIPGLIMWILREVSQGPFRPYRLAPVEEEPCIG
jgi:citrate synthase